jgi:hypothetical protein
VAEAQKNGWNKDREQAAQEQLKQLPKMMGSRQARMPRTLLVHWSDLDMTMIAGWAKRAQWQWHAQIAVA